jgi:hypothetical protein
VAVDLSKLEAVCRDIGRRIASGLPSGVGFTLIIFDFGEGERNHLTYMSNAQRADMVKTLREMIEKLEAEDLTKRQRKA